MESAKNGINQKMEWAKNGISQKWNEGLEKHYKSITHDLGITKKHTVHLYVSPKDSKSFPTHTDPTFQNSSYFFL